MAANPDLNLGPFAQDRDVAQLLASVLEGQVQQVEAVQRLRNDLQIMCQNQQVAHDQWRNRHHRGLRAPLPSIRNCLYWLDDPSAPRENNILGDIDFVYGPLEDICDLILAELGREELEGDEDGPGSDLEDNGMAGAGASRHNSYGPGNGQHRVGPIRPTGRAIRRCRPDTLSSQPRQNNFFEVSLNFDDRTFRILYR
ncbi:hypothetical protein CTheo_5242 [Ceratobasidium theobromae]|uniref:Uncharacterized protein n=1 Tax=Ceratobasidium theobromae TaxID=1582974 RepID=A0A5N5QIN8_9AGAM|nr:hypothetical protein CTheo_5242 [Ceratobasidium theobromae]